MSLFFFAVVVIVVAMWEKKEDRERRRPEQKQKNESGFSFSRGALHLIRSLKQSQRSCGGRGVLPPLPSSRKQKPSFNSLYLLKRHQFLVATYFRSLLSLLALGRTFGRREKKNDALLSSRRSCCCCKSSQVFLSATLYIHVFHCCCCFFFFLTFAYMKTPKLINR